MTTRADVAKLKDGISTSVNLAVKELENLMKHLADEPPSIAKDVLFRSVPNIAEMYGGMAAEVSADWYEEVRKRELGVASRASVELVDPVSVRADVRYALGPLYEGDAETTLSRLAQSMALHVADSGRGTIVKSARRDRAKPEIAMVPTGARTCAWCIMLASRGWHRATDAPTEKPHSYCDCQRVVRWRKESVAGYDPDKLYKMYTESRKKSGSESPNKIVAAMRRAYPDDVTDPVHE